MGLNVGPSGLAVSLVQFNSIQVTKGSESAMQDNPMHHDSAMHDDSAMHAPQQDDRLPETNNQESSLMEGDLADGERYTRTRFAHQAITEQANRRLLTSVSTSSVWDAMSATKRFALALRCLAATALEILNTRISARARLPSRRLGGLPISF
jgi:hypothetical protein